MAKDQSEKEIRKLFKDIDKKFGKTESVTVIKNEQNLMEKLEALKSPSAQALFILSMILANVSFAATPVIFFLLREWFTARGKAV